MLKTFFRKNVQFLKNLNIKKLIFKNSQTLKHDFLKFLERNVFLEEIVVGVEKQHGPVPKN